MQKSIAKKNASLFALLLMVLLTSGCTFSAAPLRLVDEIIDDKVTWSGEIHLHGLVTVKKSGRLTIQPGTRVVFEPVDQDKDGIGDSELLIEGSIVARGTADRPILFTSGAAEPKASDWKFIYVDFARQAEFDHVIAEYAYSGLQIHFCKARVTNSEFRHNVDGLRFSTVNLYAAGNRMHHNSHGVRYEERNSQALLHHNDIRNNQIGLFVVTRGDDKARFVHNNIADNLQYNVKLGWQQPGPVTLPDNWWGSIDTIEIANRFFDRQSDPQLGPVSAPRPLNEPINPAAWPTFQGAIP